MRNKWDEIEKDIRRTRNEMNFFYQKTLIDRKKQFVYPSKEFEEYKKEPETQKDVLARIMFVYVKTNNGINYTQGMNEILAIIYYSFVNYEFEDSKCHAESDTYWCFLNLINTLSSNYLFTESFKTHPMQRTLKEFTNQLENTLPEIYNCLNNMQIHPEFYAYRWILLLFSQEFNMADIIFLWDSL